MSRGYTRDGEGDTCISTEQGRLSAYQSILSELFYAADQGRTPLNDRSPSDYPQDNDQHGEGEGDSGKTRAEIRVHTERGT